VLVNSPDNLSLVEASSTATTMKRSITGFDQDVEGHWRAKLECGHYQHVRHDPPLRVREWVLTEIGRAQKVGAEIDCRKCDEGKQPGFFEN